MFDQVPVRVWLLIAIAAFAYAPARYAYRHIAASPSRRDITRPTEDISWRTSGNFIRSLAVLAALAAVAMFIFTPAAEQIARSPSFFPILVACIGAWALYTIPRGFVTGQVQPFVRGLSDTYDRDAQPRRFWASLAWNAVLGCFCLWSAYTLNEDLPRQGAEDRCYSGKNAYSPQEKLAACNELIADPDSSRNDMDDLVAARGDAYYRLGDYRRAIANYDEAIRLDSRDSYSYFSRGLIYHKGGDTEHAVADYTQAIRLRPKDADVFVNRVLAFLDTGKFDQAVADFSRAHELDPKSPWPLADRGIAYAWKNDRARAESDFKAVRAIDPSNPVVLQGEALLAMNAGDMKLGVSRLTAALSVEPDNRWSLAMRAEAYRHLGEYEKARADTDKLLKLSKDTKG